MYLNDNKNCSATSFRKVLLSCISRFWGQHIRLYRRLRLTAFEAFPLAISSSHFPRSTNEIRMPDVSKKSIPE